VRAYVGTLPSGSRGFDANTRVSAASARAFWDAGYRFAVRYVRRSAPHAYDLSVAELVDLLKSGLGVMVVQHVAAEGWHPDQQLGESYGAVAAEEARAVGIPRGVMIWCDLEGVSRQSTPASVIQFCNAWYDAVRLAGFDAGLYVGYGCRLTAQQLYWKLKFRRFWSAYNLDADQVPAVRGVCMVQGAYPPVLTDEEYQEKLRRAHGLPASQQPHRRVPGVTFEYDTDVIEADHFNNLPTLLLPRDPG
jgi:hypothetical protein